MTRDPKSSRSWGVYSNMDRCPAMETLVNSAERMVTASLPVSRSRTNVSQAILFLTDLSETNEDEVFVCTGVGEILIGEAFMTRDPKSSRVHVGVDSPRTRGLGITGHEGFSNQDFSNPSAYENSSRPRQRMPHVIPCSSTISSKSLESTSTVFRRQNVGVDSPRTRGLGITGHEGFSNQDFSNPSAYENLILPPLVQDKGCRM
jgi:hypothetical protein